MSSHWILVSSIHFLLFISGREQGRERHRRERERERERAKKKKRVRPKVRRRNWDEVKLMKDQVEKAKGLHPIKAGKLKKSLGGRGEKWWR